MQIDEILKIIKQDEIKESIGTKKEKTIHRVIKYLISDDHNNHEVKLSSNIVDVFLDNQVYEIQTRAFNLLKPKFDHLLDKYPVTVVVPIYSLTYVNKVNQDEEIISTRKSPKKDSLYSLGAELYKIKPYLNNPNLSFKIIDFTCAEYKYERLNKYHRKRLSSLDRIPLVVNEIIDILTPSDWMIKFDLEEPFKRKDFQQHFHLSERNAIAMLNVLKALDLIEVVAIEKSAYIYKRKETL